VRRPRHQARALTLFEVIISIALIALLLGALLSFFWQTLEIRAAAEREADRTQLAQQVLDRIAAELQACVALNQVGFPDMQQFSGDRRSITFITTPLPPADLYDFFPQPEYAPAPRHDLRQVTYALWIDPQETTAEGDPLVGGILRTERRAIIPYLTQQDVAEGEDLKYERRDLWSPELGYLEFRYFDGAEWVTRWQVTEGNALPQQVQVTVGFDSLTKDGLEDKDIEQYPLDQYPLGPDVPQPNRYTRIVRIPAADQMFSSRLYRLGGEVEEVYEFLKPADEGGPADGNQPAGGQP
jgi:type II secretory pathway pseudopilin PulG